MQIDIYATTQPDICFDFYWFYWKMHLTRCTNVFPTLHFHVLFLSSSFPINKSFYINLPEQRILILINMKGRGAAEAAEQKTLIAEWPSQRLEQSSD